MKKFPYHTAVLFSWICLAQVILSRSLCAQSSNANKGISYFDEQDSLPRDFIEYFIDYNAIPRSAKTDSLTKIHNQLQNELMIMENQEAIIKREELKK